MTLIRLAPIILAGVIGLVLFPRIPFASSPHPIRRRTGRTMNMFVFLQVLTSSLWRDMARRIRRRLHVQATLRMMFRAFRLAFRAERSSRSHRSSSSRRFLLSLGLLCALFSPLTFSPAYAVEGTTQTVSVNPLSSSNVRVSGSSIYASGYSVSLSVGAGSQSVLESVGANVKIGDVIAVSITQNGSNTSFGVGWYNRSSGSAGFLERDGDTVYYKCLASSCWTPAIANMSGAATYFVSSYIIGQQSYDSNFSEIRGYIASINEFMKTVVNQQVNINDNITTVANKINGVWTWLESIQYQAHYDSQAVQNQITALTEQIKNSPANQAAQREMAQADQLQAQDNTGASQQAGLNNAGFADQQQSIGSAFVKILNAPTGNCRIASPIHGMDLSLDYCKGRRPPWLGPLFAIPVAVVSILLSIHIVKAIFAEIEAFRSGL